VYFSPCTASIGVPTISHRQSVSTSITARPAARLALGSLPISYC
jgi:hypothetical protein